MKKKAVIVKEKEFDWGKIGKRKVKGKVRVRVELSCPPLCSDQEGKLSSPIEETVKNVFEPVVIEFTDYLTFLQLLPPSLTPIGIDLFQDYVSLALTQLYLGVILKKS
jgi:hypothetical protein